MDERQLRLQLCHACQQLWAHSLIAGDGGIASASLHRRRYLASPRGIRRADLTPDQLACVDIGGAGIQGDSGFGEAEWLAHRLAYQFALDEDATDIVAATITAQPRCLLALAQGAGPGASLAVFGHPPIPILDAGEPSALSGMLSSSSVVILAPGAVLAVGPSLAGALNHLEIAEQAAAISLASTHAKSQVSDHAKA